MQKDFRVNKSNKIIEARYKLLLIEQKFILMMASLIDPSDYEFKFYSVRIKEVADFLKLSPKNAYREIKKVIIRLNKKTLIIPLEDNRELITTWVSSAEYFKNEGLIEFEFSEKLKPYLLQLRREFTSYSIKNIIKLKSSYSIRIYELLKQYEKIGKRKFKLDELRKVLGITDNEYPHYANFNHRVIKVAEKELMEKTDLSFTVDVLKEGRKVTGFIFHIKKKKDKKKLKETVEIENIPNITAIKINSEIDRMIMRLCQSIPDFQIQKNTIIEISTKEWDFLNDDIKNGIKNSGLSFEEYISDKITLLKGQIKIKKINNPAGFLIESIKKNYGGIEGFLKKKEVERRKDIQKKVADLKEKIEKIKTKFDEEKSAICLNIIESQIQVLNNLVKSILEKDKLFFKKYNIDEEPIYIYTDSLIMRSKVNHELFKLYTDQFTEVEQKYLDDINKINEQVEVLEREI